MYGKYNKSVKRDVVIANFDKIEKNFSTPFLRNYFYRLASSPEAFLVLRSEFSRSLACLSICSYILGIGDRHTDNFLIDQSRFLYVIL